MLTNRLEQFIRIRNFLSYGPSASALPLLPLHVIIGPNGAGKSNLLEAVDILRATPSDVTQPIRDGGGVEDYLWKGIKTRSSPTAEIDSTVDYPDGQTPLSIGFHSPWLGSVLRLLTEPVKVLIKRPAEPASYFIYVYNSDNRG